MDMPLHPTWQDIALRLTLTVIAGAIIGFNRESRGHAAGLRTTILVGIAAAAAMIQANILLSIGGKAADSFGVMDLMRLPLGILTGVGFIGAGAILRRGGFIAGVTTAATLWIMTVIGLCFGGGQLWLGVATTAISVVTLWVLKWIDLRIPRKQHALLVIKADPGSAADLPTLVAPLGYTTVFRCQALAEGSGGTTKLWFELTWTRPEIADPPLEIVRLVEQRYRVLSFEMRR